MAFRNNFINDADVCQVGIQLIDNTSLNLDDTLEVIDALCRASSETAAVCVYPKFIPYIKKHYPALRTAIVLNFPEGQNPPSVVVDAAIEAVASGANEVDMVIDYRRVIKERNTFAVEELVKAVRQVCPSTVLLKVIIESGELADPILIAMTTHAAIEGGADFVKTSTGKVKVNATLPAAAVMLATIAMSGKKNVGFKAAGGIKTVEQAREYLQLAELVMGRGWVTQNTFRFGASSLLNVFKSGAKGVAASSSSGY